ncbi:MAG: hypothetical protein FWB72_04870 [Firmicutes bacterium]|nr:hypothetical protein [Bacillota bacterium]
MDKKGKINKQKTNKQKTNKQKTSKRKTEKQNLGQDYLSVAFDVLDKVLRGGAFSTIVLNEHLTKFKVSTADKPKVTNIVYGTLEKIFTIDYLLSKVTQKKPKPVIFNLLRLGAYLIFYFNSISPKGAVNKVVELTKTKGKSALSGFVNQTLRKVAELDLDTCLLKLETAVTGAEFKAGKAGVGDCIEVVKPGRVNDVGKAGNVAGCRIKFLSVKYNYPEWAVEKLISQFGLDNARGILSYKPTNLTHYRSNATKGETEAFFEKNGIEYTPSIANVGYYIRHSSMLNASIGANASSGGAMGVADTTSVDVSTGVADSTKLGDDFAKRNLTPQGVASILVCLALGVDATKPVSILDLCAAPGGKSIFLASHYKNANVLATDIHPHRVELIKKYASRMGVENVVTKVNDATIFNPNLLTQGTSKDSNPSGSDCGKFGYVKFDYAKFDYVLIDAPCSGFGVINKKPEIRLKPADVVDSLATLQKQIINTSAPYVKVGGAMLYSTCTLFAKENEQVVQDFLSKNKNFIIEPIDIPIDFKITEQGFVYLLPHITNTDGFFIAKLRRVR